MNNITLSTIKTKTDYSNSYNKYIFNEVPPLSLCLDVGCSTGNLGSKLKNEKGCIVDGIDFDPEAAEVASNRGYRSVHVMDLNIVDKIILNTQGKYDVILCADVLEHLISPNTALEELIKYLKPDGIFIISLPNVAFILNRINLFFGKWEYKKYGILDQTHLRFYTIKTGAKMIESSNLKVTMIKPYNQFNNLKFFGPLVRWIPTIFSYQFIVIAKTDD
jgi:2-polyprenyl-3-methyl-5-hydroxy-6-metoxy-1,4-benzoquinol methylase